MAWFSRKPEQPIVQLTAAPMGDDNYPIWTDELERHAEHFLRDRDRFEARFILNGRQMAGWAVGGIYQGAPRLWHVRAFIVELADGRFAASFHFFYEGENRDLPGGGQKMFWRVSLRDRARGVFGSIEEAKTALGVQSARIDRAAEEAYQESSRKSSPTKLFSALNLMSAAEEGDADAQYKLGQSYQSGDGLPRDAEEGLKWITRAAEQGHAEAEWLLGFTYEEGFGVEANAQEAGRWYRRAAERGNAGAQISLASLYQNGSIDGLQNFLMAIYWYGRAAEQGDADAQFHLARVYENTQRDLGKALEWYRKAADQGDAAAEWRLGRAYYEGTGVPHDKDEAMRWYSRALEKKNFVLRRSDLTEAERKLFGHLKDRIAEPSQFI